MRDGISVGALNEVAFGYVRKYGATRVKEEPQKLQGWEETGSVSRDIPGLGLSAQSSNWSNHTYEMDEDNLKPVGHNGFTVDAKDRKSTRLNSSHSQQSRMPSSA